MKIKSEKRANAFSGLIMLTSLGKQSISDKKGGDRMKIRSKHAEIFREKLIALIEEFESKTKQKIPISTLE